MEPMFTMFTRWVSSPGYAWAVVGASVLALLMCVWFALKPMRVLSGGRRSRADSFSVQGNAATDRRLYYLDPRADERQKLRAARHYAYTDCVQNALCESGASRGMTAKWWDDAPATLPRKAVGFGLSLGLMVLLLAVLYFAPGIANHKPVQVMITKESAAFYLDEERRGWIEDAERVKNGFLGAGDFLAESGEWVREKADVREWGAVGSVTEWARGLFEEARHKLEDSKNFFTEKVSDTREWLSGIWNFDKMHREMRRIVRDVSGLCRDAGEWIAERAPVVTDILGWLEDRLEEGSDWLYPYLVRYQRMPIWKDIREKLPWLA